MNWKYVSLVLLGILIGCATTSLLPEKTAVANRGKVCDYTYTQDDGAPNIGEEGEIKYSKEWSSLLSNGWRLQLVTRNYYYVFEKCKN